MCNCVCMDAEDTDQEYDRLLARSIIAFHWVGLASDSKTALIGDFGYAKEPHDVGFPLTHHLSTIVKSNANLIGWGC